MSIPNLRVGVKSDPIEYRYSYPWLFRLMAYVGVHDLQLGTFFELYQLPDAFFTDLRHSAQEHGVGISSVFTSHRELGGFFRDEIGWIDTARRNYERLIEVAALVGARSAGTNPGSIPRDRMQTKAAGIRTFVEHMKGLMRFAAERGVATLAIEPMSCLAEPPTLPGEVREMLDELRAYHASDPDGTAMIGLCADVSHGYADAQSRVVHDHMSLLDAAVPYVTELHLKNADAVYGSTFGFSDAERRRGVVDLGAVARLLRRRADDLPIRDLVGYLEIGGPKTGRDYTDSRLGDELRASLLHCREAFSGDLPARARPGRPVRVAPSLMCADVLHLGDGVIALEANGADLLHLDIMDGRFTPNMPVGLGMVEAVARHARVPLDVHLMVMDNDFFVEQLARFGVGYVSVHVESARHLDRTLTRIRGLGMKAGAALNPSTPLGALDHVIDRLDFVLIMAVNPGFAGQALVPSAIAKIAQCRRWLDDRGSTIPIEVDGNVSFENVPAMVAGGADILVCGSSSLFAGGSLSANTARLDGAIEQGLAARR